MEKDFRVFKSGGFVDVVEDIAKWARKNNVLVSFRFDEDDVTIAFEKGYKRHCVQIKIDEIRTASIADELENIYGLINRKGVI